MVLLVLLGAALLGLRSQGWAWWVVESPSMGAAAPVGTLVVTAQPTAPLRLGDVVTYQPPSGAAGTVTHRVVQVDRGAVRTRGDANAADDPWPVPLADVRGRAVAVVPGAGWALRVLPLLLGGVAAVLLATLLVRDRALRAAARLLGCSAVLCAVVLLLHPLVDAMVTTVTGAGAQMDVHLAGTGLLPVTVSAEGRSVGLVSGGTGVLHLPAGEHGRILLTTALRLPPAGWAAFAAVCGLPAVLAAIRAGRRT